LVNINAYHQPGVEAGKKAAEVVISLQKEVLEVLRTQGRDMTANEIAADLNKPDDAETVFAILRHLAANPERGISHAGNGMASDVTFCLI
jgi:glucose-6-phosphate isomerase